MAKPKTERAQVVARKPRPVRAFGVALVDVSHQPDPFLSAEISGVGSVDCWKSSEGWCGAAVIGDVHIQELIGSASPQSCLLSLTGRVKNLARALEKLGLVTVKTRRAKK